jgi:adenosine kinase
MQQAHSVGLPDRSDIRLAIIGPDGKAAMWRRAQDLSAAGIPFVFDPGQGLPMFDGEELRAFIRMARWLTVNDYEAQMLCDRTGQDLAELSRSHLEGIVVTLADQGCAVWVQGSSEAVAGQAAAEVVDPTGCGDAFRAGLLYGLERGWSLTESARLGNRLGAIKISSRGGQNHQIDAASLLA